MRLRSGREVSDKMEVLSVEPMISNNLPPIPRYVSKAEIRMAKHWFRKQLPDPAQKLFPQTSTLSRFTLFLKLPGELRDMIWDLLLPEPYNVTLNRSCVAIHASSGSHHKEIHRLRKRFPVGLRVNKESRLRTLQHYIIIPPKSEPHPRDSLGNFRCSHRSVGPSYSDVVGFISVPFWFDIKADTLTIDLWDDEVTDERHFQHFLSESPDFFSKVHRIEVFENWDAESEEAEGSSPARTRFLKYFPGLQILCFTLLRYKSLGLAEKQEIMIRDWLSPQTSSAPLNGQNSKLEIYMRNDPWYYTTRPRYRRSFLERQEILVSARNICKKGWWWKKIET